MDAHIFCDASYEEINKLGKIAVYKKGKKSKDYIYEIATCNSVQEAETIALIKGFDYILNNNQKYDSVFFYGDNLNLIDYINGKYEMSLPNLNLKIQLKSKYETLKIKHKEVNITWIPRIQNQEADFISKHGRMNGKENYEKMLSCINKMSDTYYVGIDKIKIHKHFKRTPPKQDKYNAVLSYYKKNNKLDEPLILDSKWQLTDGYIRYLVAKQFGLEQVPVRYVN